MSVESYHKEKKSVENKLGLLEVIVNRWTWELVPQKVGGALCKYNMQQGGFHGDPVSENQPC